MNLGDQGAAIPNQAQLSPNAALVAEGLELPRMRVIDENSHPVPWDAVFL